MATGCLLLSGLSDSEERLKVCGGGVGLGGGADLINDRLLVVVRLICLVRLGLL